eukprot:3434288-Lingulodinium_polyedra.AAC.1
MCARGPATSSAGLPESSSPLNDRTAPPAAAVENSVHSSDESRDAAVRSSVGWAGWPALVHGSSGSPSRGAGP